MPEKPIIFKGPMVNAILDDRKTQTRRLIKRLRTYGRSSVVNIHECGENGWRVTFDTGTRFDFTTNQILPLLEYQVGDVLWVRETWAHDAPSIEECRARYEDMLLGGVPYGPYFRADPVHEDTGLQWCPSIHMPRWAARLFLEVTGVRLERLQSISEDDAKEEGVPQHPDYPNEFFTTWRQAFKYLWDTIYAKSGHGWDNKPVVAVYEFKKLEGYK
jgi:hypothetical protein